MNKSPASPLIPPTLALGTHPGDQGSLDTSPSLVPWMHRAERGEPFDLAGEDEAQLGELTRARFDGSRLTLEHWSQGALITSIELRRGVGGDWRAISGSGGLLGACAPQSSMTHTCDDLGQAFSRLTPRFSLDWTQRLLWPAPWALKKMRIG